MIKKLSGKQSSGYKKIFEYARYLAEGINANNIVWANYNEKLSREIPKISSVQYNVLPLEKINDKEIESSVLVAEVLENETEIIRDISNFPFVIFTFKGNSSKFENILKSSKVEYHFISSTGGINFVLTGKFTGINENIPKKSVIAAVSTYNDEDIIGSVIEHLIAEEVDILVIDNWSSDKTEKIVKEKIEKYKNRVFFKKFPIDKPAEKYEWKEILHFKATNEISLKYDWIIHYDSDEIRISPWLNSNLRNSISFIDSLGFNAIQFSVLNFKPTIDGFNAKNNPEEFFTHFELGNIKAYIFQIKAWKNFSQEVDIKFHFGHDVLFEGKKVFPLCFLMKHYPLRSNLQANKKIFQDRLPRFKDTSGSVDSHYNEVVEQKNFIEKENKFIEYKNDSEFYKKYLIEGTSSVGIKLIDHTAVVIKQNENEAGLIETIKRINEQSFRNFDIYIEGEKKSENSIFEGIRFFKSEDFKEIEKSHYRFIATLNAGEEPKADWLESEIKKKEEEGLISRIGSIFK